MFYTRHFLVILPIDRRLILDILESRSHAWFDLWANGELKFGPPTVRAGGIFYNWRIQTSLILSLISLQTFYSSKISLFIFLKIFACITTDGSKFIYQKRVCSKFFCRLFIQKLVFNILVSGFWRFSSLTYSDLT